MDKQFRESYERYRAAFERKRDERVLADAAAAASARLWTWLPGTRGRAPMTRRESEKQQWEKGRVGNTTPVGSRSTTPVGTGGKTPPLRRSPRRTGSSSPTPRRESSLMRGSGATPPSVPEREGTPGEETFTFLLGSSHTSVDAVHDARPTSVGPFE